MPRYFIDTDDNDVLIIDDVGIDLLDDAAARREALGALPDMAREKVPDGDNRTFRVCVRNEAGDIVYSAQLSLQGGPSGANWPSSF